MEDIDTTPVWFWKMKHASEPFECGYRVARPPVAYGDGEYLYAAVTVNGRVLRNGKDSRRLLFMYARGVDQLLALGERVRTALRKDGWRDVEDA